MGVRAPQEHDVEHAGQRDVPHVAPPPGEQPRVLLAQVPVADELHADVFAGTGSRATAALATSASRKAAAASSAATTMF